jgi:hypothetical protein
MLIRRTPRSLQIFHHDVHPSATSTRSKEGLSVYGTPPHPCHVALVRVSPILTPTGRHQASSTRAARCVAGSSYGRGCCAPCVM